MCENTGTGPALDVMAFTLSHFTNARNALSLYEVFDVDAEIKRYTDYLKSKRANP